jgi:hypothetical protein
MNFPLKFPVALFGREFFIIEKKCDTANSSVTPGKMYHYCRLYSPLSFILSAPQIRHRRLLA